LNTVAVQPILQLFWCYAHRGRPVAL